MRNRKVKPEKLPQSPHHIVWQLPLVPVTPQSVSDYERALKRNSTPPEIGIVILRSTRKLPLKRIDVKTHGAWQTQSGKRTRIDKVQRSGLTQTWHTSIMRVDSHGIHATLPAELSSALPTSHVWTAAILLDQGGAIRASLGLRQTPLERAKADLWHLIAAGRPVRRASTLRTPCPTTSTGHQLSTWSALQDPATGWRGTV